jgi:hypothetical protein
MKSGFEQRTTNGRRMKSRSTNMAFETRGKYLSGIDCMGTSTFSGMNLFLERTATRQGSYPSSARCLKISICVVGNGRCISKIMNFIQSILFLRRLAALFCKVIDVPPSILR